MAADEFTTNPNDAGLHGVSDADFLHASERANVDAKLNWEESTPLFSALEDTLEEERARLMRANSMLGCVQIALDPEAVRVWPAVYFPEVLEMARQLINTSVRQLEYDQVRRVLHSAMS